MLQNARGFYADQARWYLRSHLLTLKRAAITSLTTIEAAEVRMHSSYERCRLLDES